MFCFGDHLIPENYRIDLLMGEPRDRREFAHAADETSDQRSSSSSSKRGRSSSKTLEASIRSEETKVLLETIHLLTQAIATFADASEDLPFELTSVPPHDGDMFRLEVRLLREHVGTIGCVIPVDELYMNTDLCSEAVPDMEDLPYVATAGGRRVLRKFISQGRRRRDKKKPARKARTSKPEVPAHFSEEEEEAPYEEDVRAQDEADCGEVYPQPASGETQQ